MKKVAIGIITGAILVAGGTAVYNWFEELERVTLINALQTADPSEWVEIVKFTISDASAASVPLAQVTYEVKRLTAVRVVSSPRNVETGETICAGRTPITIVEPQELRTVTRSMAGLAGVETCDWPPGRYVASITFVLTDEETNVQLKPIILETNEFVVN